jgi:hypothetical protein
MTATRLFAEKLELRSFVVHSAAFTCTLDFLEMDP